MLGGLLVALATAFVFTRDTRALLFVIASVVLVTKALERHGLPLVQRWAQGADGEEHVGDLLDRLGKPWHVLHDVSTGRGNIDHIAIGPGGVYTIETKSHRTVARIDQAWLKQAYAQSCALRSITAREVTPLLVFSRARITKPGARHRGVTVLPADALADYLHRRPPVHDPTEAAGIHALISQALTAD